jgi:hypothetical protein
LSALRPAGFIVLHSGPSGISSVGKSHHEGTKDTKKNEEGHGELEVVLFAVTVG